MRILFTGATSFTGMWFVRTLSEQGHNVTAAIRGREGSYSGLRKQRLELVRSCSEICWGAAFGTPEFLDLISRRGAFDVLCHHAAVVDDYKNPAFDAIAATAANAFSVDKVLERLRNGGCKEVILTGSVFEANEGAGSSPLRAVSAYGLSKTLTAEIFSFYAERQGLTLRKFVIANPFGPYEEPRFTNYLMQRWREGRAATVNTPFYVRDNIHVSLLAAVYSHFVSAAMPHLSTFRPSFYVETQGAFAQRFANEIGQRLNIRTPLEFFDQIEFSEPLVRINTDAVKDVKYGWSEEASWDGVARYYSEQG